MLIQPELVLRSRTFICKSQYGVCVLSLEKAFWMQTKKNLPFCKHFFPSSSNVIDSKMVTQIKQNAENHIST